MTECCAQVQSQSNQAGHPDLSFLFSLFQKSLFLTRCEIPRRRQDEKDQEADICYLWEVNLIAQMEDFMI